MSDLAIVAISVGNTRTAVALFDTDEPMPRPTSSERLANDDLDAAVAAVRRAWEAIAEREEPAILIASVNHPVAERLRARIAAEVSEEIFEIGSDVAPPIGIQLDPEAEPGVDRLLNAAAAWRLLKSACVVVDAGTAVTVDFVDGVGTFQGGAIAPGASLQLAALHDGTAALPSIDFHRPDDDEAFAKNTAQAMLQGVFHGIRGLVWRLVEQYATAYGAFPAVVATGGDAAALFEGDELVDRIVPDLTLMGIAIAARAAGEGAEGPADEDGGRDP